MDFMKVGELARRTGLSVRTLHHYDEIGLLRPSRRTPSGHRLYGPREVARLQQITSLKQAGLSLREIAECLEDPSYSLRRSLDVHLTRLEEEIAAKARLRRLLEDLRDRLDEGGPPDLGALTRIIEGTVALERYYSAEELDALARRRTEVGPDRMEAAQREWMELLSAFGRAMEEGLPPDDPEVTELARRATSLVEEFTGGDAGIRASLTRMYEAEGGEAVLGRQGISLPPGLWGYMQEAAGKTADR